MKIIESIVKNSRQKKLKWEEIPGKSILLNYLGITFHQVFKKQSKRWSNTENAKFINISQKHWKETRIYCFECKITLCPAPFFRIYLTIADLNQIENCYGYLSVLIFIGSEIEKWWENEEDSLT